MVHPGIRGFAIRFVGVAVSVQVAVAGIPRFIPVQVRLFGIHGQHAVVQRIGCGTGQAQVVHLVVIRIAVAGVTGPVTVQIGLVRVGRHQAVVQAVGRAVPVPIGLALVPHLAGVLVFLFRVGHQGAVVVAGRGLTIGTGVVAHRAAAVPVVQDAVVVLVVVHAEGQAVPVQVRVPFVGDPVAVVVQAIAGEFGRWFVVRAVGQVFVRSAGQLDRSLAQDAGLGGPGTDARLVLAGGGIARDALARHAVVVGGAGVPVVTGPVHSHVGAAGGRIATVRGAVFSVIAVHGFVDAKARVGIAGVFRALVVVGTALGHVEAETVQGVAGIVGAVIPVVTVHGRAVLTARHGVAGLLAVAGVSVTAFHFGVFTLSGAFIAEIDGADAAVVAGSSAPGDIRSTGRACLGIEQHVQAGYADIGGLGA